jgi:hypothetical protein
MTWHASRIIKISSSVSGCKKYVFMIERLKSAPKIDDIAQFVAAPSKVNDIIFTPALCNMYSVE